jgi:hypothetical protein
VKRGAGRWGTGKGERKTGRKVMRWQRIARECKGRDSNQSMHVCTHMDIFRSNTDKNIPLKNFVTTYVIESSRPEPSLELAVGITAFVPELLPPHILEKSLAYLDTPLPSFEVSSLVIDGNLIEVM